MYYVSFKKRETDKLYLHVDGTILICYFPPNIKAIVATDDQKVKSLSKRWDRDQQMISSRLGGDLICTNYESLSGQGLGPLDLIHSWNMHHNDQISDHIWSLVTDWSKAKDDLEPIHNWNMQKSDVIRVWSKSGEDNPPQPHLHLLLEKLLFFILQCNG